jgi:hypothetical protein
MPLPPLLASLIAAPLLLAAPRQVDGMPLLDASTAATAKHAQLRALVRQETKAGDSPATVRFVESWIDARGGRVRTATRDFGRAAPHLVQVHDGQRLRAEQLEIHEVAELVQPRKLHEALVVCGCGELVVAAFTGKPSCFLPGQLGKPQRDGPGVEIAGVGCSRLLFPGAAPGELWIGDADLFPRRIRAKVGEVAIEETLVELDLDAKLGGVDFEIAVPEGRKLRTIREAFDAWRKDLGPDASRWPPPQADAPDFAGVDLESKVRMLSETSEQRVVLAFWTPELPASVEQAAALEAAWRERKDPKLLLWHVAAGRAPAPVREAVAKSRLREPVVIAGEHRQNAFEQFSIWRTPVFVRIDDLQVIAISDDLATAKSWLR